MRKLPPNWQSPVVPWETRHFGAAFLQSRRAVALIVPTVLIPEGYIAVLNPLHPNFDVTSVSPPRRFFYDPRLE